MTVTEELKARLTLDKSDYGKGLLAAEALTNKLGSKMIKSFNKVKIAAYGIGIAAAATITMAIKKYAEYEGLMRNVGTLIDADTESIEEMSQEILDMGRRVPKPINELAAALYQVRSAGISAEYAMGVLEQGARLAVAGLSSTQEAVTTLNAALNAFGISAEYAESVANILFKTVKFGVTTMRELAQGFGAVAPVAATFGVKLEELMAATAAMTKTGLSASEAYTQVRAAIFAMAAPAYRAASLMRRMGVANTEALISLKGFLGALLEYKEMAAGSNIILRRLLGSQEAVNITVALTGKRMKDYTMILKDMLSGSNSLIQAYAIQCETLNSEWQIFLNNLHAILITAGKSMKKHAEYIIGILSYLLVAFEKFVQAAKILLQPLEWIAIIVEAIQNAQQIGKSLLTEIDIRGQKIAISWLTKAIDNLKQKIEEAEKAGRKKIHIWGIFPQKIEEAKKDLAIYEKQLEDAQKRIEDVNLELGNLIRQNEKWQEFIETLGVGITGTAGKFEDELKKIFENALAMLPKLPEELKTAMTELNEELAALAGLGDTVKNKFELAGETIDKYKKALSDLKSLQSKLATATAEQYTALTDAIAEQQIIIRDMSSDVKEAMKVLAEATMQKYYNLLDRLKYLYSRLGHVSVAENYRIQQAIRRVRDELTKMYPDVRKAMKLLAPEERAKGELIAQAELDKADKLRDIFSELGDFMEAFVGARPKIVRRDIFGREKLSTEQRAMIYMFNNLIRLFSQPLRIKVQAAQALNIIERVRYSLESLRDKTITIMTRRIEAKQFGGMIGERYRRFGTDRVMTMLTPGEFVVSREAARMNRALLEYINVHREPPRYREPERRTKTYEAGAPATSEKYKRSLVNVIVSERMDRDTIRRLLIPEMQRAAQRGRI